MNYIELIRTFWRTHEEYSFSTTEIALYLYLVEVSNICRWKNPFRRNNAKVQADLTINYNTLKTARNNLRQAGLLRYETKNGSPDVIYTLTSPEGYKEVKNEPLSPITAKSERSPHEVKDEVMLAKDKPNKNQTKPNQEQYDYDHIIESWNILCPHQPKVKKLTEARKSKIQNRLNEISAAAGEPLHIIQQTFQKINESPFMRGENKNGWRATFDWVMENEQNIHKILEGNYDNRNSHHAPAGTNGYAARAEERRRELDHFENLCQAVLQCDIPPHHS